MLCSFVPLHILFILSCKVAACTMRCLPRLSFSSCHLFAAFHFSRFLICCSLNAGSRAFVKRNLSRSESSVTCNLIGFPSFTICSGFLMMVDGFDMLVKLLSCFQQMTHLAAVEDVKREVNIMQALSGHENVVQFHNAYEDTCT
ncbi:putative non-specific serine/threonine protein kinase [Helianthus annuus]|nr:putative non-specific serine/threonine protein kinase [Helianthus annuus]